VLAFLPAAPGTSQSDRDGIKNRSVNMLFEIYCRRKNTNESPIKVKQGPFARKKADEVCRDMAAMHRDCDYWKEAI